MADPILFGAAYSVYTRIARLALIEKGVSCRFEEVDIFAAGGPPSDYLRRHPFGKIPALGHDGFDLYETAAITRYVDEAFSGPSLQPKEPRIRARMAQLIGVLDAYGYRAMVWDIFVERARKPQRGELPDEAKIAAAVERTERCFDAIEAIMRDAPWLAGEESLTLADLHAAPMIACLRVAPEGAACLSRHPRLYEWWERISSRASMQATPSPMFDDATAALRT
ncbi:glutathione S-transferase family protein [Terrarubrum flagellatum]|uniref:glutathione S-transferase family protein n=1 Tax=Terrirubrum flagellatum TaxID=2895980 RepID=UPI0031451AE1